MKIHTLERRQMVQAPLDLVFPFFARPENLERITPPTMRMEMLTPSPIPMHPGVIIDYVIKVNGIPMRWTTAISEYEPPHRFVDVQLRGPYSFWHHTHTFTERDGGTEISDVVRYALPFGPLGGLVHRLMVRRQLEAIFRFREAFIGGTTDWHVQQQVT